MFRRRSYPLWPYLIRLVVPASRSGTYSLFEAGEIVYTGRSDTDLRRRLLEHARAGEADAFQFDVHYLPEHSFDVECATYHTLRENVCNEIHPATPRGTGRPCSFCAETIAYVRDTRLVARTVDSQDSSPTRRDEPVGRPRDKKGRMK